MIYLQLSQVYINKGSVEFFDKNFIGLKSGKVFQINEKDFLKLQSIFIELVQPTEKVARIKDSKSVFCEKVDGNPCDSILDQGVKPQSQDTQKTSLLISGLESLSRFNKNLPYQASEIIHLFATCGVTVKKGKHRSDIVSWNLTDKEGNKALLTYNSHQWSLSGDKKGFFEMDFDSWLDDNDIERS